MKKRGSWNSKLEQKRYEYKFDSSSIIIDLGAYTGEWAKSITTKFNCKVHSYEAVKRYFDKIQHPNIITYHYGVTCNTGIDHIHVCDEGSSIEKISEYKKKNDLDSSYQNNIKSHSNIPLEKINTIDINDILDTFEYVDLLKINIEGAEYEILEKMCNTNTINKVQHLQIQFHNFVDNAQTRYDDIVKQLTNTHHCDFDSLWRWSFWTKK